MSFPTDSLALAHLLANAINPTLAGLLLVVPLFERRGASRPVRSFAYDYGHWILCCAISLAIAVVLAESGKRFVVWPGHPGFPSGHETFAASTATMLVLRHRAWAAFSVPIVFLMAWALVRAGYHDIPDVWGGLLLGSSITLATSAVVLPRRRATPPDI